MNPLSSVTLMLFRQAFQIVQTGKDDQGNSYSTEGCLNQAAWIGEHAGLLLDEIDRLKKELNERRSIQKAKAGK